MIRRFAPRMALAGAAALGITVTAALTISPTSKDFGNVVVGVPGTIQTFAVTVAPGGSHTDSLVAGISGPDAADFLIHRTSFIPGIGRPASALTDCQHRSGPAGTCELQVEFFPLTLGPKTATLTVFDYKAGGQASASLKGNGEYGCRAIIVPCNYGAFYNGTISWSSTLNFRSASPNQTRASDRLISVTATVTNGQAVCGGTVTENRGGSGDESYRGWLRAAVGGRGLFAVEFDKDAQGKLYYLVTIACPSEAGTDSTENLKTGGKDGNDITATLPELDGREMQSDKQPATLVGMNLTGSITFRHPDEDPLNGVNGTVTVTWALKGQRPPP